MLRQNNREGVPGMDAGYAFVADERVVLLRGILLPLRLASLGHLVWGLL